MTHGKGREFKKLPPITQEIINEGHLELLLFEAERAWSFSQDLINQSLLPANKENASTLRHSATGRFRRAVHWSTQLLSHCQALYASSRISASSFLEATIYTVIINGRFLRYREEFEDAIVQLSVARSLLDDLAASARTSRDQALAVLFADGIGPEIRYCAHELGRAKSYDIDGIVAELAPKFRNSIIENCDAIVKKLQSEVGGAGKDSQQKKLRQLLWEDQPVPVRNPELVDVLLKVQEAEDKLTSQTTGDSTADGNKLAREKQSKKGVAAYDAILSALSDAEDVARKLVEAQQLSGGSSSAGASGSRDIHFVHAYIVYQLLSRRIQRDLLLTSVLLASQSSSTAKDASKRFTAPEQVDNRLYPAVVKLLETVVQSLDQMRTLSIVDDSPDLASAVEARLTFTKARRCLFLAHCYTPLKKYAESLILLQHASLHTRETSNTLSILTHDPISSPQTIPTTDTNTPKTSFFPLSVTTVKSLEEELAKVSLQFKCDWFSHNGGSTTRDPKNYEKPTFFNIALNYVPLNMDQLMKRAGKEPPKEAVVSPAAIPQAPVKVENVPEKKPVPRAKVEQARPAALEPQAPARGGISSLLGAWWGRS
ncbi:Signal recognition particle subunit SRP68 [Leucoagaricus sp. SymC.cos]|nr:Signal recognition particle subunit SRP68 [Leucoagaricus sp. SymC.cos]